MGRFNGIDSSLCFRIYIVGIYVTCEFSLQCERVSLNNKILIYCTPDTDIPPHSCSFGVSCLYCHTSSIWIWVPVVGIRRHFGLHRYGLTGWGRTPRRRLFSIPLFSVFFSKRSSLWPCQSSWHSKLCIISYYKYDVRMNRKGSPIKRGTNMRRQSLSSLDRGSYPGLAFEYSWSQSSPSSSPSKAAAVQRLTWVTGSVFAEHRSSRCRYSRKRGGNKSSLHLRRSVKEGMIVFAAWQLSSWSFFSGKGILCV
jgi:hypothetical protein